MRHHFFLVEDAPGWEDYTRWPRPGPEEVELHDDVVEYLNDTLRWLPTVNPALRGQPAQFGLNLYGVTALRGQGAALARQLFTAWAELFALAPPRLELTGDWTLPREGRGNYERLELDRDALCAALGRLAQMAARVEAGGWVLVHRGI